MKGFFVAIGFLFSCAFAQIQIDEPIKQLGDIFEDKGMIKTFFTLKNPYPKDTIYIRNINTSCGCTAALVDDTIIRPRSSVQLAVAYDPEGRVGLFMKSIEVETVTGIDERNSLYLKISGNVISEKIMTQRTTPKLVDYKVAPIYFFPITEYDTSYLNLNYLIPFINDLTFEIDYFKFAQLGFEVTVNDEKMIEGLELLINAMERKAIREFKIRGFNPNQVLFSDPIFKKGDIPIWSIAKIKVKSDRYNEEENESTITLDSKETIDESMYLLQYELSTLPNPKETTKDIQLKLIESKLFLDQSLTLQGLIRYPKNNKGDVGEAYQNKLEKRIFKFVKEKVGVGKENLTVKFDSLAIHPKNKFQLLLWDPGDEEYRNNIMYREKAEEIIFPFLPTLKQYTIANNAIDQTTVAFEHFWQNLLIANRGGSEVELVIESSVSQFPREGVANNLSLAVEKGNKAATELKRLFKNAVGTDLEVEIIPVVRGPQVSWEFKKKVDFTQYEYLNIIPVSDLRKDYPAAIAKPYMVNFDYYFLGIDTSSWILNDFIKYINTEIQRNGIVELRMESSISQIKIERRTSNEYLAFARLLESQKRLKLYLKKKLIDPNRVIFKDEQYIIQGPKYDSRIPILKYRKFQYIKIVPEKYLKQEK